MSDRNAEILEDLLTQLRAALVPYFDDSDPSSYVAMYADRVTYFDPWSNGKVVDDDARTHLLGMAGSIPAADYEISSESVDVYGDIAVLTLNLAVIDRSTGQRLVLWNTTQVHCDTGPAWELVHAHWSFAEAPPAPSS